MQEDAGKFSQNHSLGAQSRKDIAAYLRLIGDGDAAKRFQGRGVGGQSFGSFFRGDEYAYTGILLGHIATNNATGDLIKIDNAIGTTADVTLKDKRIKITLDKFYVQNYPGSGTHTVLCEFTGKNQIVGGAEEMRFAITTTATDKGAAAVSGAPIFLGASVGKDGISFEGRTVNVKGDDDETLLQVLGSDTFKDGLSLLTKAQPALKPFVGLAGGVVKAIAGRSKNRQVYSFKLGLDFGSGNTSARLLLGSYVVVQADEASWDWASFGWKTASQFIVRRDTGHPIEFNYMVFGVSIYEGQD